MTPGPDTHISAIYHATAPALAAALATGEAAGADGGEFLTSYIAGLEIGCRLGRAAEGERDTFGAQLHAPLLDIAIPA